MIISGREWDTDHEMYIMGILNVTPDSFSDGGNFNNLDAALRHTEEMIRDGAAIIDVGGESTRPGYTMISDQEEIERVVPVIEAIKARFDTTISVDTYKSQVARAAITAGADLLNDIWGLKYDPDMAEVIAKTGVACCLMHNRNEINYKHFLPEVLMDLEESVQLAKAAGIADEKIMLDPGIGFGKTYEMNLEMMKSLASMHSLGYPILLGTSRKSMIGFTLDLPRDQREEGTFATTAYGAMAGCAFYRVHNVAGNIRILKMMQAMMREHDLTDFSR